MELGYRGYSGIKLDNVNGIEPATLFGAGNVPLQGSTVTDLSTDSDISSLTISANIYHDINTKNKKFTPFVQGGIGFTRVNIEAQQTISLANGNDISTTTNEDDTVFAYQVGIGGTYKIDEEKDFVFGYRYFATEDVEFAGSDVSDIKWTRNISRN